MARSIGLLPTFCPHKLGVFEPLVHPGAIDLVTNESSDPAVLQLVSVDGFEPIGLDPASSP